MADQPCTCKCPAHLTIISSMGGSPSGRGASSGCRLSTTLACGRQPQCQERQVGLSVGEDSVQATGQPKGREPERTGEQAG
jgi:hypothetical protein